MSGLRLLALDTSTAAITAAVYDGADVVAEAAHVDARAHTERVAPTIATVLASAGLRPTDLTAIAVGVGPGPFTGLRVGIVTGLTMGHALDVPVFGVCSLDALARAYVDGGGAGEFLVATDARRKEVYWARYEGRPSSGAGKHAVSGRVIRHTEPAVNRPADLPPGVRELPTIGRGGVLYPDWLREAREPLDVSAGALARVAVDGIACDLPMPVVPLYLRRPDAQEQPTSGPARASSDRSLRG